MNVPELERDLEALAAEVAWPPTPELRLQLDPRRRRRFVEGRRALVLVVAVLLLALAVAFAVPSARTAILRFFHLRGATVELVDRLPPAQERDLGADLANPVSLEQAERDLGFRILLPPHAGRPPVHEFAHTVSMLLAAPEPVLLTELHVGNENGPGILKKLAGIGSGVEWVDVGGDPGLWVPGGHVFFGPGAPARIAGNVLLWVHGGITLRLEGKHLAKNAAIRFASTIR